MPCYGPQTDLFAAAESSQACLPQVTTYWCTFHEIFFLMPDLSWNTGYFFLCVCVCTRISISMFMWVHPRQILGFSKTRIYLFKRQSMFVWHAIKIYRLASMLKMLDSNLLHLLFSRGVSASNTDVTSPSL